MNDTSSSDALRALGRFARARPPERVEAKRCEMCGLTIDPEHRHVANVVDRSLLCVCRPCALLFAHDGASHGKFRAVPDRYEYAPSLAITDAQWNRLGMPVRMAFFLFDTSRGKPIAFYPSPAGATEALFDEDAAADLGRVCPAFASLTHDVEAWLVDGRDRTRFDGYVVPIPTCYELVAHVRMHWRGFDGGERVHDALDAFFHDLRTRASEGL